MGIESKVFTVVINIVVGIVLGCQPIIGYNIGAGNYARVKRLIRSILLCTVAVGLAATLLFVLAPHAVARLFGTPTNIPNPDDYWLFAEKTFRHLSLPDHVHLHRQGLVHLLSGSGQAGARRGRLDGARHPVLHTADSDSAALFRDRGDSGTPRRPPTCWRCSCPAR